MWEIKYSFEVKSNLPILEEKLIQLRDIKRTREVKMNGTKIKSYQLWLSRQIGPKLHFAKTIFIKKKLKNSSFLVFFKYYLSKLKIWLL